MVVLWVDTGLLVSGTEIDFRPSEGVTRPLRGALGSPTWWIRDEVTWILSAPPPCSCNLGVRLRFETLK